MKHRAPTAPARGRHAAVTHIVNPGGGSLHRSRHAGATDASIFRPAHVRQARAPRRHGGQPQARHAGRHVHPEWRHTARHAAAPDARAAVASIGVGLGIIAAATLGAGPLAGTPPAGHSGVAASNVAGSGTSATGAACHTGTGTSATASTGQRTAATSGTQRPAPSGTTQQQKERTSSTQREASPGSTQPTQTPAGSTQPTQTPTGSTQQGQAKTSSTKPTPAPDKERATAASGRASRGTQRPSPSPKPKPKPKPKPTTAAPAPKLPRWRHPLPSAGITSCYGMRWGVLHAGIDLATASGTPIHAVGAGRVVSAGWNYSGYGISVMIDHGNGYLTHYAHMSRTTVHAGQRVSAGQVIGREGSTGDSTGPHLHFEVHKGLWNQIDPAPWLRARGINVGC